jgi:hypothetical protein
MYRLGLPCWASQASLKSLSPPPLIPFDIVCPLIPNFTLPTSQGSNSLPPIQQACVPSTRLGLLLACSYHTHSKKRRRTETTMPPASLHERSEVRHDSGGPYSSAAKVGTAIALSQFFLPSAFPPNSISHFTVPLPLTSRQYFQGENRN